MSLITVKEAIEMVDTLLTKKPKKNARKSNKKSVVSKLKTFQRVKEAKQEEPVAVTKAPELALLHQASEEPSGVPEPPHEMPERGDLDALLGPEQFLTPEQEREIIRRVQEGDREAFEELVNAYKRKAYYTAMSFVNNHEDALDLSQDAFVKAFKAIKTFDLNSPFFPWFYKIIKNHCLNYIKKSSRMRNDSIDELEEEQYMQFREHRPNPREQFEQNQQREQLWEAINRLKPDFREIIIMKHFHNHSYKEIADALNIPIGTVMSRLFNARQELREKYLEVIGEKN
ncbi:MAG: RNA polymerase sigma factor [Candidatus Sumerlaeaceae bacterium]|jgi:RNA polymerase sigma-70 factor (ECF subfamily)